MDRAIAIGVALAVGIGGLALAITLGARHPAAPTPDTTPPDITGASVSPINPPVNGSVTISASITDAGSGVANVSAHVVGPSSDENLTMLLVNGSRYAVSHAFAKAGNYEVTIWATDKVGNTASRHVTFAVGSTPPSGGGPPADDATPVILAGLGFVIIVLILAVLVARQRRRPAETEPPEKWEPPGA